MKIKLKTIEIIVATHVKSPVLYKLSLCIEAQVTNKIIKKKDS